MDVNKIKILLEPQNREIVVPLGMNWDFMDREGAILQEEEYIIDQVKGDPLNYELTRFSRRPINNSTTSQGYEFYFYSALTSTWENTFLTRFSENQVLFDSNPFRKSFFKLDLYDTTDPLKQKIYLTIILDTSQGLPDIPTFSTYLFFTGFDTELSYINCDGNPTTAILNPGQSINFCPREPQTATARYTIAPGLPENVFNFPIDGTVFPDPSLPPSPIFIPFAYGPTGEECNCETGFSSSINSYLLKPKMSLDFVGDQKGYFIYWYQDPSLLNITTLYMKAKFFDANIGSFVSFSVEPQSNYVGSETKLDNNLFYYQVNFDYPDYQYFISRVGSNTLIPVLEWYEYVNAA